MAIHHILVYGKVQGVFYRKYTHKTAVQLSLTGWVRNVPDGSVEIMVEGPLKALESLEKWCYEGSPKSKVTKVVVEVMKSPNSSANSSSGLATSSTRVENEEGLSSGGAPSSNASANTSEIQMRRRGEEGGGGASSGGKRDRYYSSFEIRR